MTYRIFIDKKTMEQHVVSTSSPDIDDYLKMPEFFKEVNYDKV